MTASSGASFAGRHAAFEIVVGHELEVRAHLVGQIVIESAAKMQGSSEFRPPFAHGSPLRGQNAPHSFDEAQPSRFRGNELRAAQSRQAVILGAASVEGFFPLRRNPAPLQQALQRGVKRAIVHEKLVFGLALEKLRNAVGVIRCNLQAAKNEHFKRALEQFEGVPLIVYRRHPIYLRPQNVFVKCLAAFDQNLLILFGLVWSSGKI